MFKDLFTSLKEAYDNRIQSTFVIGLYYTEETDSKNKIKELEKHFDELLYPYGIGWSNIKLEFKDNNFCIISGKIYSSNSETVRELEDELRQRLMLEAWDGVIDSILYIKCIPDEDLQYYITECLAEYKDRRLCESSRAALISKSRGADNYANSEESRWTAKKNCSIANTVADYNKIDMNTFWKDDVLKFKVKVKGVNDTYLVTIEFNNILDNIQKAIKKNDNKLDYKCVYNSLIKSIGNSDIKVSCTCPDYKYRLKYWNSTHNDEAEEKETRKANITNPEDSKGAGCKHILAVLNNVEWLRKIASVIHNYINYCKDEMEYNYSKYMFPKLYGMSYDKAVQLTLRDYDENGKLKDKLDSDEAIINLSNALGKVRGRIKKGSNKNPVSKKEESLQEKIVKKGSKYQVQSEKGRNMGTYDTKEEAKKRLQQIEYFKHLNEEIILNEDLEDRNQLEEHYKKHVTGEIKIRDDYKWDVYLFTDLNQKEYNYKSKEEYFQGAKNAVKDFEKGWIQYFDKDPKIRYYKYYDTGIKGTKPNSKDENLYILVEYYYKFKKDKGSDPYAEIHIITYFVTTRSYIRRQINIDHNTFNLPRRELNISVDDIYDVEEIKKSEEAVIYNKENFSNKIQKDIIDFGSNVANQSWKKVTAPEKIPFIFIAGDSYTGYAFATKLASALNKYTHKRYKVTAGKNIGVQRITESLFISDNTDFSSNGINNSNYNIFYGSSILTHEDKLNTICDQAGGKMCIYILKNRPKGENFFQDYDSANHLIRENYLVDKLNKWKVDKAAKNWPKLAAKVETTERLTNDDIYMISYFINTLDEDHKGVINIYDTYNKKLDEIVNNNEEWKNKYGQDFKTFYYEYPKVNYAEQHLQAYDSLRNKNIGIPVFKYSDLDLDDSNEKSDIMTSIVQYLLQENLKN